MYLHSISISGFRIFEDFSVVLDKNLNLIVGENNSGKTALIDAIRYALSTNSLDWIRIQESDFHRGQTKFSIQLKFDDVTVRQAAVFAEHLTHELLPDGQGRKSVLYVNFRAEQTDQIIRGNRLIRTEIRSGMNADGPNIEREVRDYLSATYLRPLRDAEAEMMGGRGSRLAQVLQASERFRDSAVVEKLLSALIDANKRIIENEGIKASLDRITLQLRGLDFTSDPLDPTIEILGGTNLNRLNEAERKQMFRGILERLQLLIDETDRHQGLGYSNLLFMATELLLLEQEQDDFPLLLIEEPEAHLHPQLQMKFLKAIREDFGGPGKPALQSILTTHSPNLASKAPLENVIIMAAGKAYPLSQDKTELDPSDYTFLEKFLDVTKSNLFFAKGVIIVEGDGESILLPTLAELIGRPLEDYGVSIVNVGSTAFSRFARIFRRKGLDEKENRANWLPSRVACLRDLDLWPEKAKTGNDNPFGFVPWKEKNKQYWESYYTSAPKKRAAWIDSKRKPAGQNVHVEISDHWTFEYSMLRSGLAEEIYEAFHDSSAGFTELPLDEEERALTIFQSIATTDGGKTKIAYALGPILSKKYSPQRIAELGPSATPDEIGARRQAEALAAGAAQQAFRAKLPKYVVNALEYVTGVPVDSGEAPLAEAAAAHA
jgi:putative ATP-dependent endonuclease of OLD family